MSTENTRNRTGIKPKRMEVTFRLSHDEIMALTRIMKAVGKADDATLTEIDLANQLLNPEDDPES